MEAARIRENDEADTGTLKLASSLPARGHYIYGSLRRRSRRNLFGDPDKDAENTPITGSQPVLYPELPKVEDSESAKYLTRIKSQYKRKCSGLRKYASNSSGLDIEDGIEEPDFLTADFTTSLPSSLYLKRGNREGDFSNSALNLSEIKDAKDLKNLRLEASTLPQRRESRESIANQLLQSVDEATSCFARKHPKDAEQFELKDWRRYKGPVSLQYKLETFTEARSTCWAFEPYIGQPIDGSSNGSAPGPWDIPVSPLQKFVDSNIALEVPHTASLKPCHECVAIGRVRCYRCQGKGRVACHHCNGKGRETFFTDGRHQDRSCSWCDGNGKNRCAICYAHGQVPCRTCEAKGQLKCYIRLTVTWTNHIADHIVERSELPDKIIKAVQHGTVAFEEELPRVWAINHFPDQAINKASAELIRQHTNAYPSERIIVQRQKVRLVPMSETQLKSLTGRYNLYPTDELEGSKSKYSSRCCFSCLFV